MKNLVLAFVTLLPMTGMAADRFILFNVTRVADRREGVTVVAAKAYGYDESGAGKQPVMVKIAHILLRDESGFEKTKCSEKAIAAFARGANLEIFIDENDWWTKNQSIFNQNKEVEIPARAVQICAAQAS